jgi:outer membrane lipopolysaccharide assembly protein LptE/RlpB
MNNLKIKSKTIQTPFLIAAILLLVSCDYNWRSTTNNKPKLELENSIDKQELLIGSWKDTSKSALHISLFKNGTARSDNMKTLLYKNWSVKGNQITFTIESIGNGNSTTENVTYIIEKLTNNELILRKGIYLTKYKKE